MKRIWMFLLAMILVLGLCGCSREYTFPKATTVLGADVSGCTKEEAWAKLEAAAGSYGLDLTVDGIAVHIAGQDIDLTYSQEAFLAAAEAMDAGTEADFSEVIRINEPKLKTLLEQHFSKEVTEAAIVYDESAETYVLTPHADGMKSDLDALTTAVKNAVCTLTTQQTLTGITEVLEPAYKADDPEALAALELINKMTGIKLAYDFLSDDENNSVTAQEIAAEHLRSFIDLGENGFTPTVNPEAVKAYAETLSESHNVEGTTGSFQTTGGSTVNLKVDYNGLQVDTEALCLDIAACMQEGISETRPAPYLGSTIREMPYGGTYIEINLNSQHLWFYKDGECIVSTDVVSGTVAAEMNTPNGVFTLYSKTADTYLVGEDYRSFVSYWMPFYGAYGLHDSTWRDSFGDDIYLYNGSHGCVNLPLWAAKNLFSNASVGTKVIIYGGVDYMPRLDQKFSGCTSYDVADDTKAFTLDIKAKNGEPELTYKSDNTKVATVSKDGTVTIKGTGTANITVTAEEDFIYAEGSVTVKISVHSACEEGRHVLGKPVVVKKPSCQPGLEQISCTKCDHVKEKTLEPVKSHTFGDWVTTKKPTCGAEGTKERTCTICGTEKETGSIPATGDHTPGEWETVTEPTCTQEGKQVKKCTTCGKELESAGIEKTDHRYDDGPACTICGKENPDYTEPPTEETTRE